MAKPIQLENGRWQVRPAYKDPVTDKWIQKLGTFDTKSEALSFNNTIKYEAERGLTSKQTTIGEFYGHWMDIYKKPYLKPRSIKRIDQDFKHIFDYFGRSKELTKINKPIWQGFMNDISKKYAKETNRLTNGDFRALCECAIDEGIITRNPTQNAKYSGILPKYKYPRQKVLNLQQFKNVVAEMEASQDSVSKYACLVHAFTGMRFGEVCGLTWDKINMFKRTIRVSRQYDYSVVKGFAPLKGDSPERTIDVPEALMYMLRKYKHWYDDQLFRGNIIPNTDKLMFTGPNGSPVTDTAINNYIKYICGKVGITRITSHGFRRTQATLMTLADNDLRSVASFLGHQDTRTTLKYYIQDIPELKKQAHEKMMLFYKNEDIV